MFFLGLAHLQCWSFQHQLRADQHRYSFRFRYKYRFRYRENTPARGVALVHGGQRPISLEYQINPPLHSYLIL